MKLLILGIFLVSIFYSESQTIGDMELIITNAKSDKGLIQVLVFNKEDGFPEEPKKAIKAFSLPISNSSARVVIEDLPAGNYAVSVFHDEDSNGQIQKNNFGMPVESYGFSNNPTLYFGPPSFSKCTVAIKNVPVKVEISLR